jgi:membrane protein
MSGQEPRQADNALLIMATVLLVLSVQHYFQGRPAQPLAAAPNSSKVAVEDAPGVRAHPRRHPGWRDWKLILWRSLMRSGEDRLLATAAGVVFYGLLAVFPAITALVSCYGLFANPATISANLQTLALMLPDGSYQIVQDQIARVLGKGHFALSATFVTGLLFAIWSANAGVKAVLDALNVAQEQQETRSFIKLNLVALAFTSGGIAALLLMVAAVIALPLALDHVGLAPQSRLIVSLARWPLLLLILLAGLGVLYRFGPSRRPLQRTWIGVGGVAAAVLWIAGSALLSWYLSNFGNYSATYGSLGAAIGLMMWMWMSAIIVLYGAQLNSEFEQQLSMHSVVETSYRSMR